MNYCNEAITKGTAYQVIRNGVSLAPCHGLVESITETGYLHIGFAGVTDIKTDDILIKADNQIYHVIYTALTTEHEKNDKRLVICETDISRKERKSDKTFSRYHEVINTIIALLALLVALFKN